MSVENSKPHRVVVATGNGRDESPVTDSLLPTSSAPLATLYGRPLLSNQGIPLHLDWVKQVRVNTSAVERRQQSHVARRTVKKDWQAAWLLRAITCMDLTTLSGDDTDERVRRLCAKARRPILYELVKGLGIDITGSWKQPEGRLKAAVCELPLSPPDSPQDFLPCPSA